MSDQIERVKAGDIVTYSNPQSPYEANTRFVVIEAHYDANPPRVHVKLLASGMTIAPREMLAPDDVSLVEAC
jgi:hypothetical protein